MRGYRREKSKCGKILISGIWEKEVQKFLAYFCHLVAQMVKNLPAMWKTLVQSLGQEDLLEKKLATHSSILAWRIPWTEEPGGLYIVHGVVKSQTQLSNSDTHGCRSLTQSCLTLQPHGLQHARLPCPSPSPAACSNSSPLSG
ncbi:unnamed protein product [Rangifer tarandus platyrhynchus]|uniref:Uncharacterized protein n=1 Tax=Rangifer tarandus platyrhynchus TaxID=3082113 RepID=A0AC60A305_RANTA